MKEKKWRIELNEKQLRLIANCVEDMKQIIREFPGTIARKVSASGKLYGYDFTDEQLDWLEANYVKRFKCKLVCEKLGKYSDNKTELTDADREALRDAYRQLAEASVSGVVSANPGVLSEENKADYVKAALTVVNDNVEKAKTLGEAVRVM